MKQARTLVAFIFCLAVMVTTFPTPAHAVPTSSISFTASPTAKIGEYNLLTVSITSSDGVTQPEGGVIFRNQAGEFIGSAATGRGSSVANAVATLPWWPTQQTSYTFTAQYNVAPGVSLTGSSTPSPFSILATPSGQNVSMSAPQMYLGIPATMTATVYPSTLQGSVGFTGNGWGLGPSVPISSGGARFSFTPGSLGWQQFGVSFTSTNVTGAQGQVAQWVNVLPASALPVPPTVPQQTQPPMSASLAPVPVKKPIMKPAQKPTKAPARPIRR
jgi:hypothetical protein